MISHHQRNAGVNMGIWEIFGKYNMGYFQSYVYTWEDFDKKNSAQRLVNNEKFSWMWFPFSTPPIHMAE